MSNLENLSLKELQDLHDEKREELNAVAKKTESFAAIVPWHIAPPRVITQEGPAILLMINFLDCS